MSKIVTLFSLVHQEVSWNYPSLLMLNNYIFFTNFFTRCCTLTCTFNPLLQYIYIYIYILSVSSLQVFQGYLCTFYTLATVLTTKVLDPHFPVPRYL